MWRLDLEIAAETGVPLAAPGPVGRAHPDGGGLAPGQQFEHAERGVTLIQVIHRRLDAERAQGAYAADAKHRKLRQPDRTVTLVEP